MKWEKLFIPPVFVITGIIINTLLWLNFEPFNIINYPFNWMGFIPAVIGLSIFGNAVYLFKKYQTTLQLKNPSHLVKEGMYLRTRNPIYLGMIIFLTGLAICFKNVFGLLVPIVFYMLIRKYFISKEEALMDKIFGQEYKDYKVNTPRWL